MEEVSRLDSLGGVEHLPKDGEVVPSFGLPGQVHHRASLLAQGRQLVVGATVGQVERM